ncbi:MAG TPA: hypothetical protein ENJ82_06945 [Bacteroidetes bacterium]|nr:hypothetical protein [Bacteroidota bacterium]
MSQGYLGIGSRIKHEKHGLGVVIGINSMTYTVMFIENGEEEIRKDAEIILIERVDPDEDGVSLFDVEQSLLHILQKWSDITEVVPLGERWTNGKMILRPFDSNLKEKEIPIEAFFHKIVMLRDRLRVLEQRINSHKKLSDEDKVNMQQYITRVYGSLTTFNVLFKNKADSFMGESSK